MPVFRIAHISDTHFSIWPNKQHWFEAFSQNPRSTLKNFRNRNIADYPSGYSPEVAEHAARKLFELRDEIDMVVLTGDVATVGDNRCLRVAREFTHSPVESGWLNAKDLPTLQASAKGKPLVIIPGNHDRFKDEACEPNGERFDRFYEDVWPTPAHYVHHVEANKEGQGLLCISVDFCLRSISDAGGPIDASYYYMGRGKAYRDAVGRIVERTLELRAKNPSTAVFWSMHFPPTDRVSPSLRLVDFDLVSDAAADNSIPVILAGHLHEEAVFYTTRNTPILCAGSLTTFGQAQSFSIVEFNVNGGRIDSCRRVILRMDHKKGEFAFGGRELIFGAR